MATEIIRTIKSSGGDYTSRSAFEAAVPANIVTTDEQWSGVIDAFVDTTAVSVSGITTDATRYVEFRVAAGQGHAGKWDATKAMVSIATGRAIDVGVHYTRIVGDQITESGNYENIIVSNGVNVRFDKCIIKSTGASSVGFLGNDNNDLLRNSIIYDCDQGYVANLGAAHYLYNVIFQNCNTGVNIDEAGNTLYAKNVLVKGGTTCFAQTAGTMNLTSCASSDATADDWGGTGNRINQTFTFVDEAGDDLHLASTDAGARDFGTDLSADANYPFSDDIDGQTRSGSWDIGADEYISAGGALLKLVAETLQLSETRYRTMTLRRYKNETENITEGVAKRFSLRRLVNETLQLIDNNLRILNLRRLVTETINIADNIYKTLGLKRLINETIQITDTVNYYIQKLINKVISETLQISDSILKRLSIRKVISETLQITESISRNISFRKIISETERIVDSALKAISFRKIISETIQISDQVIRSVLGAMVRIISEAINIADSNLRRISFHRIISESENIIEAVSRRVSFRKVIPETVFISENIINNKFFSKIVNEVINVTEQIGRWLGVLGGTIIKVINETVWINDIASLFKIVYLAGRKAIIFYIDNIKRTFTVDNIKRTFYGK